MADLGEDKHDKKEHGETEHISIKVVAQDGGAITFKIKKTTQLKKLMTAYCDRAGLIKENVRFVFDGNNVLPENTPLELDMEEGDGLEVFNRQTGGHLL